MLDDELAGEFHHRGGSGWLATHAIWSLVACHTQHHEAAGVLLNRLSPWRDQFISTHFTLYGPVAYPVGLLEGLLGRRAEAEQDFALALRINERMEAPFFSALTQVAWARLVGDTDVERSHDLATAALALAVDGGFGAIEKQSASLVDVGGGPR
jgi:hypothetical protein